MYSIQYSSTYNNRYEVLSKGIRAYGERESYRYTEYLMEGEIFLVGTLEIRYNKQRILSSYSSASRKINYESIVQDRIDTVHKKRADANDENIQDSGSKLGSVQEHTEYYLESPVLERVKVLIAPDTSEYLVEGIVIGVLGEKTAENHLVAKRIIHTLDAIDATHPHCNLLVTPEYKSKKEDKEEAVIVIPTSESIKDAAENAPIILLSSPLNHSHFNISNKIYAVPDEADYPQFMLPWSIDSTAVHDKVVRKGVEMVANPSVIEIEGIRIGIVNIESIRSIVENHNGKYNMADYFKAMCILLKNNHLSPLSPFSCPSTPMATDSLVMAELPDVLLLKCEYDGLERVVLNEKAFHLLLIKDKAAKIEKEQR
ncbi:hypothetical protein NEMIN01_1960 [Nematocida minor]|uniref:uncharacterized protein n=1 Tax=Nematocida minor TaxID=1912983 RepID=UPI00221FAA1F|nr:uncharacterized protein NEMIN01_1960 [Nematocida minor]KAI5192346.1 hypothetical protein NEMIN01_1960 [Nematocida minor]